MLISLLEKKYLSLAKEVESIIRPLVETLDINTISKCNAYYTLYERDRFYHFVENEKRRYFKALDLITHDKSHGSVCDVGCMIPYLPLALARLGYSVKIIDNYDFYGYSFKNAISALAEKNNIQIFDVDILNDSFDPLGKNDVVINMAVVEHLNGTPRFLLKKIHACLAGDGIFIFDVPNIADFLKRIRLMMGISPLADYDIYFNSTYPHIGHNREMTIEEVRYMLLNSDFIIDSIECYDFNPKPVKTIMGHIAAIVKNIVPLKNKRESIIAKARKK